jgi:hypothetical protein
MTNLNRFSVVMERCEWRQFICLGIFISRPFLRQRCCNPAVILSGEQFDFLGVKKEWFTVSEFCAMYVFFFHANNSSWNYENRNGRNEIWVIKQLGDLGDQFRFCTWLKENEQWYIYITLQCVVEMIESRIDRDLAIKGCP